MQQPRDPTNSAQFEQTKVVDKPLSGGGILPTPSNFPRLVLLEIGMSQDDIVTLEKNLTEKRSAKEQKDIFRDIFAAKTKVQKGNLERAGEEEGLLHQNSRKPEVEALPEKLLTYSMVKKKKEKKADYFDGPWHGNLF